jgi:ribosomal protein S18 acetylase RimI-like enzyme
MNSSFALENMQITFRRVEDGDEQFLYRVYASTRAQEMELVDWTAAQKEAFLQMQFDAQSKHYREYYPGAEYQVIQRGDGLPIGRLIVDRSNDTILLMDIALLPEFRNAGIGTTILQALMAEAAAKDQPVKLQVEVFNPAVRLYERMGFVKSGEQGIYREMVWRPGGNPG